MAERLGEQEVARLRVRAEVDYLPVVALLVREMGRRLGLSQRAVFELEHAVDEAATNIVQHAFEPDERGEYTVRLLRRPGRVVVALEDQGIPFDLDKFRQGEGTGLGRRFLEAYADQWNLSYLGPQGKRLEIVKHLPHTDARDHYRPEELDDLRQAEPAPPDEPLALRLMQPQDAVALARCVYRTYGYSYTSEYIYYPERTREMLASGEMTSCVAVNPAGEIVGHIALIRHHPQAKVAESGQALVDPRYRGRGLFKKGKLFLVEQARRMGLYGLFSESVTIHPYTQKGNLSLGARETGLLLGYAPQQLRFKRLAGGRQTQRQTVVLYYLPVNPAPRRTAWLPPRHAGMIQRLWRHCGLERRAQRPEQPPAAPHTHLEVKVRPEWGHAFIAVEQAGAELVEQVRAQLEDLCIQGLRCIYLDLPLALAPAAARCAELEELGFFFAGLLPEMHPSGDVLRLQYLHDLRLDLDQVVLVSELGRELMAYIRERM
jgi:serine/threonine-protein kinase RsbW